MLALLVNQAINVSYLCRLNHIQKLGNFNSKKSMLLPTFLFVSLQTIGNSFYQLKDNHFNVVITQKPFMYYFSLKLLHCILLKKTIYSIVNIYISIYVCITPLCRYCSYMLGGKRSGNYVMKIFFIKRIVLHNFTYHHSLYQYS